MYMYMYMYMYMCMYMYLLTEGLPEGAVTKNKKRRTLPTESSPARKIQPTSRPIRKKGAPEQPTQPGSPYRLNHTTGHGLHPPTKDSMI